MKKFLKISGSIVLIVLLLLVVTPWFFKDKIAGLVKDELNKQVNANVDFQTARLSLLRSFPNFSLSLKQLSVINQQPFEGDTLAYLGSLTLTVDLMSVISGGPYVVKRIALDKVVMNFLSLKTGEVNWDIVATSTETTVEETGAADEAPLSIKLNQLTINDAQVVYEDQSLGMNIRLQGLDANLKGDFTANVARLQLGVASEQLTVLYDGIAYLNKVAVDLKLGLQTDLEKSIYSFDQASLRLNQLNMGFDGTVEMPAEDIMIQLNFNALNNNLKHLLSLVPAVYASDFDKLTVAGDFSLGGYVKGIYNDTQMPGYGVDLQVNKGSISYPDLPTAINNITISGGVVNENGDPDASIVRIKNFGFDMGGNPFEASLLLKTPVSDPDIAAAFKGTIDLSSLKSMFQMAQDDVLAGMIRADLRVNARLSDAENQRYERIDAGGNLFLTDFQYQSTMFTLPLLIREAGFSFTPAMVGLDNFRANIGASDVELTGRLENYLPYYLGEGILRGNLKLQSTLLDMNAMMSALPESEETPEASDSTMSVPELPERIDFAFDGNISKLLFQTYELSQVETRITYKDKKIVFDPLKAQMLGGGILMNGSFEATDTVQAGIDFDMQLTGIDIPSAYQTIGLFSKAAPIAEKTTGNFSTTFKLNGTLDQMMNPVFESLAGGGTLKTSTLVVESSKTMASLATALGNEKFSSLNTDGLNISFEFLNGKVYQKPFQLKYAGSDVTIGGSIDFNQNLDYDLLFKVPFEMLGGTVASGIDNLVKEGGKLGLKLNPGTSVSVKAKVTGTSSAPKVELDYKGYASDLKSGFEDMARKEIEKQKEELKKKVKVEAAKILEDARKQADELMKQAEASAAKIRSEAATLAAKTQSEANKQADNLIAEGKKKGMVAEMAAKEAAKKVRKEGDNSAARIVSEGDKKANEVIRQAQSQSDEILRKAQERADKL